MPLSFPSTPTRVFSLHDTSNSPREPSPSALKKSSGSKDSRHGQASRSLERTPNMNGTTQTNGNGDAQPRRRSERLRNAGSVDLSASEEVVSPATQTKAATRSRPRKSKSTSKSLSLDILASQALVEKTKKIDYEIPRKVLHSSIGRFPSPRCIVQSANQGDRIPNTCTVYDALFPSTRHYRFDMRFICRPSCRYP